MKSKRLISCSNAGPELTAFLSMLAVLILHVNGNDTKAFKASFKTWFSQSAKVLDTLGIKKEFTIYANKFLAKEEFDDDDARILGKLLKSVKHVLVKDITIPKTVLDFYNDCAGSLATDSMPAWKRIIANVSLLQNARLNAIFLPEEEQVEDVEVPLPTATKKLKSVVTKLTGRPDKPFIHPEKLTELRKEGDEDTLALLKEYSLYVRSINKVVKAETLKYVRQSGKDKVLLDDLKDYLKKKNVINDLPVGFLGGLIDEKGKMYTKEGRQLERVPFGTVIMNKKYDPEKDNTYVMNDATRVILRYRTIDFVGSNKDTKHAAVKDFYKNESSYRAKWLADLSKSGNVEQFLAAMVEIMYQTSARIGGVNNKTKGETTYGLTTLQVQHVTLLPGKAEFNYSGKKAAEQHHEFKTTTTEGKKVGAILKSLLANKEPTDLVFTAEVKLKKGRVKQTPLSATMVNNYLKGLGIEITAHKFRQLAGTKAAMGILNKSPFKKGMDVTQKEAEDWVKEELKKVGEILHHRSGTKVTGMTAVKSYIAPEVLKDFFTNLNLRVPSWVPTK